MPEPTAPAQGLAGRRAFPLLLLGVVTIQWLLLWRTFPLSELLTEVPLLNVDAGFHWYQVNLAQALWADGRVVGFDPWFAAGHIGGVPFNASAKAPALLAVLTGLDAAAAYKLHCAITALICPACVLVALRLWRADPLTLVVGAVLGVLMYWVSALRWYYSVGMVSFVLGSFLALPYVALLWRAVVEPLRWWTVPILSVVGALGMLNHPLFGLPVLLCAPFLVMAFWRDIRWRQVALIALFVPTLVLLFNLPWLVPTLRYPGWSDNALAPFQKFVDGSIIWNEALGRITERARGARINPILIACSVLACWGATVRGLRRQHVLHMAGASALLVFAAFGAVFPVIATLQPNRASAVAFLFLALPASHGLALLVRAALDASRTRGLRFGCGAAVAAALALPGREMMLEIGDADVPRHGAAPPEVKGPGDVTRWLEQWLRQNTNADARVLFETSLGRIHDGSHIAGYLAIRTQREFIGGPYVYIHHAGFWDGYVFGRPISAWSAAELSDRLKLYNIKWLVVHSQMSRAAISALPNVTLRASHGPVSVYEVAGDPSYFLEGSGRVRGRSWNRLELEQLSGATVVLKYHHAPRLRSEPPTRIEPVQVAGDPAPFIKLIDPPKAVVLSMD